MELTLEILLYFIREMNPVIYKMNKKGTLYVGIKRFYPEDKQMSENYLYISELEELRQCEDLLSADMTVLVPDVKNRGKDWGGKLPCNLVLVDEKFQVSRILNQMIDIFSRMANWDKMMHIAALEGKSLQHLVDISEEILEHPLIIFDASFDVLAYTKHVDSEYRYFRETINHGYTDAEIMGRVKQNNILARLKNGEPLVAPAADESSTNVYLAFYSNQTLLGYGCIFYEGNKPEEGYLDVLKCFIENVTFCLRRDYENQRYGQMMYETFLINLMNPSAMTAQQMQEQLENIEGLHQTGRFVLGVLDFNREEKVSLAFLARLIDRAMWNVKPFIYEDKICLLKIMDEKDVTVPVIGQWEMDEIERLFANYDFKMGISNVFGNIQELFYGYIQANAALKFGQKEEKIFSCYADYYDYHIFSVMEEIMPIELLQSEVYQQLQEYDRKNHTKYVDVIISYLKCECNATHTAEKLFLHRNTVRNIIRFVEEQWKLDISDTEVKKKMMISHLIDCYKMLENLS